MRSYSQRHDILLLLHSIFVLPPYLQDTCSLLIIFLPCITAANLLANEYTFLEICWTFSQFLEGLSLLVYQCFSPSVAQKQYGNQRVDNHCRQHYPRVSPLGTSFHSDNSFSFFVIMRFQKFLCWVGDSLS